MFKKLLQLKTLLILALLAMVGNSAWAQDESVTFSSQGYTDAQEISSYSGTNFSVTFAKGTNSNAPKYYNSGTAIRCYGGNTITVSSSTKTIASVQLSFGSKDGSNAITASVGDYSQGEWKGSANSVTFTIGGSTGNRRIAGISVTYEAGGTSTLPDNDLALTGDPVALSFDLYNNATAQVINYTTSSTGAVTIADNDYAKFVVDQDNKTITVTPTAVTPSTQTITVSQAADDSYAAGSVTFTLDVIDSTPTVGGWVETALADLTADDVFVIVGANSTSTYAMSNGNGTTSAPSAVKVTVTDDEITSKVTEDIKWTISGDATNGYTFYPAGSTDTWLYCTNTNNGVRVGDNNNNAFTVTDGYLKHNGTSRYVGVYQSQDWRCYTSINNNISGQTFKFYKYEDESTSSKVSPELAWSASSASAIVGEAFTAPTLTNPNNLTVTYSSMDASVATVNESTGAVTIKGVGTTIITANFAGNDTYKPGTASYTLVVSPSTPVGVVVWKEDWSGFGTDKTPAVSGNASYVYTNGNSDTKLYDENYAGGSKPELLINRSGGAFAATIPLFGAYGNMTLSLKANNKPISVKAKVDDDDNVTLTNSGDDTSQIYTINNVPAGATQIVITLTNNSTDSNVRVDDFLLIAPQVGVRIGAAGYSTMYYGSSNLVVPADVVVRTYKVNNGELEASIEYTEGDVLAKAQGYVIKGTAGTYTFTATKNDASVDANNQLRGSDVAVTTTGGTYYYGLSLNAASEPQSVGFYWMEDNGAAFTNGAHKAYLALNDQFASGSAVRGFLLNGTNTGVETLPHESMRSGIVYDLQGRRVNNPGSGLYIINGQKVFNK